ncbi:MraY family glycosyltransferase [Limnochorda pilosa]|uniref:Glycosyl transferase n=1 Tax=Limnochorda pilosa TaxID=1555112 RepID=A0A0K2SQ12_LIMPI|nr:MraY family glycosyltransferase [Limnochorda pilosa]BAS28924.1 glycosyl transferase [Limnochorda pilosa]
MDPGSLSAWSLGTGAILALSLSLALSPLLAPLARRLGWMDEPSPRRIHGHAMPKLGGLAIFGAFFAGMGLVGLPWPGGASLPLAALLLLAAGLVDDRVQLPAWAKLLAQVAASLWVVAAGVRIEFLTHPLGGMIALHGWSWPVTVFWLVLLANMINLVDGLDGLAAGVASIATVPLLILALQRGEVWSAAAAAVLLASLLGFLRYNFHPAGIFMGDAGAQFVGWMLGIITVEGALKGAATLAISVPLMALGLPLFDTCFAILRRLRRGVPIYQADLGHIHHGLLAAGVEPRRAVGILYVVSGLLGLSSLWLATLKPWAGLVVLGGVGLLLASVARRLGVLGGGPPPLRLEGPHHRGHGPAA